MITNPETHAELTPSQPALNAAVTALTNARNHFAVDASPRTHTQHANVLDNIDHIRRQLNTAQPGTTLSLSEPESGVLEDCVDVEHAERGGINPELDELKDHVRASNPTYQ